VFTKDQIEGYMELKWEEIYAFEHTPHPVEFKHVLQLLSTDQLKELKRLQKENERLRKGRIGSDAGQADPGGGRKGKLLSPARRRACIDHVRQPAEGLGAPNLSRSEAAPIHAAQTCPWDVLMKNVGGRYDRADP
jgi:hypothetical protein